MGDVPESILHSLQMNFRVSHVRPSAGGWGLSGARVYQAVSTNKSYCLRRWPAATTSARLGEVHGFMRRYRDAGCLLVPELFVWPTDQSWRHDGAHFWDLTQWMSGRSLTRSEIDRETLILAIQAIASLHRLAGLQGSAEQIPPAITARIARIDAIIRQQLFAKTTGCVGVLGDLASRGERLWRANHQAIRLRLCEAARQPVATHWVLRDIHLEHILFDSTQNHRRVSGIIDYDAVRVDTPAADLARFISSCGEVPSSWVVDAVRVYRESCRFCKHSESLIPLLMTSTSLIACANWTQWLCLEGRVFDAGRQKAINRFQLAIEQAEMLFP